MSEILVPVCSGCPMSDRCQEVDTSHLRFTDVFGSAIKQDTHRRNLAAGVMVELSDVVGKKLVSRSFSTRHNNFAEDRPLRTKVRPGSTLEGVADSVQRCASQGIGPISVHGMFRKKTECSGIAYYNNFSAIPVHQPSVEFDVIYHEPLTPPAVSMEELSRLLDE